MSINRFDTLVDPSKYASTGGKVTLQNDQQHMQKWKKALESHLLGQQKIADTKSHSIDMNGPMSVVKYQTDLSVYESLEMASSLSKGQDASVNRTDGMLSTDKNSALNGEVFKNNRSPQIQMNISSKADVQTESLVLKKGEILAHVTRYVYSPQFKPISWSIRQEDSNLVLAYGGKAISDDLCMDIAAVYKDMLKGGKHAIVRVVNNGKVIFDSQDLGKVDCPEELSAMIDVGDEYIINFKF